MRIDEIELVPGDFWHSARVLFESGRMLWLDRAVTNTSMPVGQYSVAITQGDIGEYREAHPEDSLTERWIIKDWGDLDILMAQCVLFEIMKTEKVARVLRGKLLGAEYSHL